MLELDVLKNDQPAAKDWLLKSVPKIPESREPTTTARNLRLIRLARSRRGEDADWVAELESELLRHE